jgi:hypothetical protein
MHLAITAPLEVRMRDLRHDAHPFLRPFDWFTRVHRTEVGRVTFVLLYPGVGMPILVPLSLSVAGQARAGGHPWIGNHRILLFPSWGDEPLKKDLPGGKVDVLSNPHHLSIDGAKGKLQTHITQARLQASKPWHKPKKVIIETGDAALVASLLIKHPHAMDIAGTAITSFDDTLGLGAAECERRLSAALSEDHPILRLPLGPLWDADHHLRISILVTPGGRLVDRDYPVLFSSIPSTLARPASHPAQAGFRFTKIPLTSTANLLLAYAVIPGVLKKDIYLV